MCIIDSYIFILLHLLSETELGKHLTREVKSREISPENLLLSVTVNTKHSQCPVALGSCFVFCWFQYGSVAFYDVIDWRWNDG